MPIAASLVTVWFGAVAAQTPTAEVTRIVQDSAARPPPGFLPNGCRHHVKRCVWRQARIGLLMNVYNLFNTTNGEPTSVQNDIRSPLFGKPLAALPGRQVELGVKARWE